MWPPTAPICQLPIKVLWNIQGHLNWIDRYALHCAHPGLQQRRHSQDEPQNSRLDIWRFHHDRDLQTVARIPNHNGFIDGVFDREVRCANQRLFTWKLFYKDHMWADYRLDTEEYLALRVPIHEFRKLLAEEAGSEQGPARDLQLTDPPVKRVFVYLNVYELPSGQPKHIKNWDISSETGVCLGHVMEEVLRDIDPTLAELPLLTIRIQGSVCPTIGDLRAFSESTSEWKPEHKAKGPRVDLASRVRFDQPYYGTADEVKSKLGIHTAAPLRISDLLN